MPPKKHIESESSSSSMEKFTTVSQLSASIKQINVTVNQLQATLVWMETRHHNLENDRHGSDFRCVGQEIDIGSLVKISNPKKGASK